ncbi:maleylacetate reductase [Bosea thiooxidans]|nr:maleylacetate reductase [Bosea sp. (in: a-proteobacteria)]
MQPFTYESHPTRVVFGDGTIRQVRDVCERSGMRRPLVLSTPQQLDQAEVVAGYLAGMGVGIFDGAVMHTPVDVTEKARAFAETRGADGLVAIGGGSTTGLAKAISIRTGLPQLIIPTTYAGSEMTPILGETKDGLKTTRSDSKIRPHAVIYDVGLTLELPKVLSATSGLNAIAHAAEALYARDGNPIIALMAQEGIAALSKALPEIEASPRDPAARWNALYGAWLCGTCLGSVGMALHHKLCHTIAGSLNLPHAETHAIVLPHSLAFNAPATPDAMLMLQKALKSTDAIEGLNLLTSKLDIPRSLMELGMREYDISDAADKAVLNPYWNPRSLSRDFAFELIRRAWAGEPARAIN